MTAPVAGVAGVAVPAQDAAAATGGVDVLPEPAAGALDDTAKMFLVLSQMRESQGKAAMESTEVTHKHRQIETERAREALQRAQEEAAKGGFLDWLSKDMGIIGAAALATAQWPVMAADIAMHKVGVVDEMKIDALDVGALATGRFDVLVADALLRKTAASPDELRDLLDGVGLGADSLGVSDEDIQPYTKRMLEVAIVVAATAGSVLSCGTLAGGCVVAAGLLISYSGQALAKTGALDGVLGEGATKWVGVGMQIYGAAAAGVAGATMGATSAAKLASTAMTSTTTATRSADQVVLAVHAHDARLAELDAERASAEVARMDRYIDELLEIVKESKKAQGRIQTLHAQVTNTQNETMLMASRMKG